MGGKNVKDGPIIGICGQQQRTEIRIGGAGKGIGGATETSQRPRQFDQGGRLVQIKADVRRVAPRLKQRQGFAGL